MRQDVDAADRRNYQAMLRDNSWIQRIIEQHEIIHSHVDPSFVSVGQAAQNLGKPWVHTYHTMYFAEDYSGGLQPWQADVNESLINVASHADIRLSVSPWLSRHLKQHHGISTVVVPNGVDVSACDRISNDPNTSQSTHRGCVLFLGSIDEIKNPRMLLKAAESLPEFRFTMVGTGLSIGNIQEKLACTVPKT